MYWTTFGSATVAMKRVGNTVVDGRPDVALNSPITFPPVYGRLATNCDRHFLNLSAAHLELKHYDEAFGILPESTTRSAHGSLSNGLRETC